MDVVRLGPVGSTDYLPDVLIEGYTSMIWTERYLDPGDFELKTNDVEKTWDLLPENTLISLLDTDEVMIVETHEISVNDLGHEELTIKGMTLDGFLDHRYVEGPYNKRRKLRKNYTATGAALVLIWNSVDNNSGVDVTREGDRTWNTKDKIPNVAVSDSVVEMGASKRWWVKEGPLYPQLMDILTKDDLGIRMIRPKSDSMKRVSVNSGGEETRGDITRTVIEDVTALRFDLYRGLDRSAAQSENSRVTFNISHGDIEGAKYLFSNKEHKTGAEIMSGVGGPDVYRTEDASNYEGLFRRIMSYDGGEPELPPNKPTDPGKNATTEENNDYEEALAIWQGKADEVTAEFLEDIEDDALRALKRRRRLTVFSGDISLHAPYKYKRDYGLGDTITLYGKYDQEAKMFVAEYVRTDDREGDRGYPGLVLP